MKKTTLSLIALLLTATMLVGIFASCGDNLSVDDDTSASTEAVVDSTDTGDSENKSDETETQTPAPSISDIKNGLLIENANKLANGVNAYFTDGKRTDFALVNQNMSLEYALANHKDQLVTSLVSAEGNTYLQSTMDVFVKMKSGHTFYASDSTKHATANLYRFGYYMYEARFEEQVFVGDVAVEDSLSFNLRSITRNQAKPSYNDDGSLHLEVGGSDPYISFKGVDFAASDYNFVQFTMKANATKPTNLVIYLKAGSKTGFTESQAKYFNFYNDGEYHTYTIPISEVDDYTGQVTGLRFDLSGEKGSSFDISDFKVIKGDDGGTPANLSLNRSFFVYSDKMHHYLQVATGDVATTDIDSIGLETKISADTVAKLIVKDKNGTHTTLDGVDFASVEYVGFDIKDAGIFGYILPADNSGGTLTVTLADGVYTVIQSRAPENGTIEPSGIYDDEKKRIIASVPLNGNDFFMGQRIYTDSNHGFDTFLLEAELERHPLTAENFIVDTQNSTDASFAGYDALRGIYTFKVAGDGFNGPYYRYPNKHYNIKFTVKGDNNDRSLYIMAASETGCLESAALLDDNNMMIPIPIEVGKNFSESSGERNRWNIDDKKYGEAIIPMLIKAGSEDSYNFINLYQNWGQYPLKQVSWIQFYAPYYHLSTGVTETNCIVPYYSCKNARGLNTLPDHRTMSAPFWSDQPQHNSCGSHKWLVYTDANGVYSASENARNTIDSYGPTYADVTMDYISDDGNIKVTYTHTEFPQTDENRAYYEMKYEVLGDVSFTDFSRDFHFYRVSSNDPTGVYQNVGYLNENNQSVIVNAAVDSESNKYVLGNECPYFSYFNMKGWTSTSQQGYANLSFLVYNSEFVIGGQKATPNFAIVNDKSSVRISLDLGEVTLKEGDSFVINAIVLPWGSQESVYDSKEFAGDQNVRDVREDTLLNPLTPKAVENCEVLDSVFVPKLKTTNGKNATFTLTGGENNVAVRIYGFDKVTVPVIEELVDGKWVEYKVSSAYAPDIQGNAHYYDGYCVHYDGDGTFSYSFIVTMDNKDADGRTFRIAAEEDFKGWPEELPAIDKVEDELPLNVYVDAEAMYNTAMMSSGPQFDGVVLSADKSYVSFGAKGLTESYFSAYPGGTVATGQYLAIKYRLPESNPDDITVFEVFTSTTNSGAKGEDCFYIGSALINDGEWHIIVADLASWGKPSFKAADDGTYKANYARLDPFYKTAIGNSFQFAFFGLSDNLEDIYALASDLDAIQYVAHFDGKTTVTYVDPATGESLETPTEETEEVNTEETSSATDEPVKENATSSHEQFTVYVNASDIVTHLNAPGNGHGGEEELMEGGEYVRIHYCTDQSKNENYRRESYFYIYEADGSLATGQMLVIKYRTYEQIGSIQIYASTQKASASDPGGSCTLKAPAEGSNGLFIGDGEWHTVVIDLSELIASYTADSNGQYAAKHVRIDLFNFNSPLEDGKTAYVDIAYIGLTDDASHIANE
ncbi:MAG: hypothetical protein IJY39_11730 [Clostridia bacterium]|nr:hypothetical protein [Clostridia bacterium]